MNRTAYIIIALLILCPPLPAGERRGEGPHDLYSKQYFPAVHEELQNAKESIVVTMYQIRVYPNSTAENPAYALLQDLIDAHKRGVEVTVITSNPFRSERAAEAVMPKEKRNNTIQMLAAGGITARHVSFARTLHQKLIVIDGETVIMGSHNWSDTALKSNIETSTLIRSKEYAALKLKQISELNLLPLETGDMTEILGHDFYFAEIKDRVPSISPNIGSVSPEVQYIYLPLTFLTRKDLAPDMMKDNDERTFDLYLLLIRKFGDMTEILGHDFYFAEIKDRVPKNFSISLNHTETASALGMSRRDSRTKYRRQITKTLRKLQNEYGLIEAAFHYAKNTDIKLIPLKFGDMKFGDMTALRSKPDRVPKNFPNIEDRVPSISPNIGIVSPEANIKIPIAYWQYNLSKKLTFSAKTAYLICLAEEAESPGKPWWSASGNALANKYPGTRETIGQGLRELEKMNLLEIIRSTLAPGQPYAHRKPNSYRLKPLYSPEDIKKQWKELSDIYGRSNLKHARAQAGRFDSRNDPAVVSELLRVADIYSWKLTEKAVGEVAKMNPGNPYRHMGYVITLLRDWSGE